MTQHDPVFFSCVGLVGVGVGSSFQSLHQGFSETCHLPLIWFIVAGGDFQTCTTFSTKIVGNREVVSFWFKRRHPGNKKMIVIWDLTIPENNTDVFF